MNRETLRGWCYGLAVGILLAWFTWAMLDGLAG